MKLKEDHQRLKELLKDTITLLCKNGLQFKDEFSVEALIGITLDQDSVFLVNIKETIQSDSRPDQTSDSETEIRTEQTKVKKLENSNSPSKAMKRPSNSKVSHETPQKHMRFSGISKVDGDIDDSTQDSDCVIHIKTETEDDDNGFLQDVKDKTFPGQTVSCPVPVGLATLRNYSEYSDIGTSTESHGLHKPGSFPPANESVARMPSSYQGIGVPNISQQSAAGNHQTYSLILEEQFDPSVGKFVCSICGRLYSDKGTYKQHLEGAHGLGQKYTCTCNANFSWKRSFNRHKAKCSVYQDKMDIKLKDNSNDTNG